MPGLVAEILGDYGTILQKIGLFLRRRNGSTIECIVHGASLTHSQAVHGLSLMIQRRLVKYFQYEKKVYYVLDTNMAYRRMYFGIYCSLVEDLFGEEASREFMKILVNGFTKVDGSLQGSAEKLVDAGVVISMGRKEASILVTGSRDLGEYMARAKQDEEMHRKSRKTAEKPRFYIIDFDALHSMMINSRLLALVKKRYLSKAERIYRSILRCNLVTVDTIMGNLEGEMDITRGDVVSCIKYFSNYGLLRKSLDCTETYFKDGDDIRKILVVDSLNRILSENSKEARRIFNMMLDYKALEDKDIVVKSLVPSHVVKKAILMLHSNGFVVLKHTGPGDTKPVPEWQVDIDRASRIVGEEIKRELEKSWALINQRWRRIGGGGDDEDGGSKELSRMLGLSLDFFVLGIQNIAFKTEIF
ncbi:RNA polymerase III subunit RPC82 helix-turn-helix domain-containing protein [Encephalitozoon hellem]|nr:RNA polymerase III subunit RPC82 helix-turn-helix domain-containing protein [Encephalitozoon hellem]